MGAGRRWGGGGDEHQKGFKKGTSWILICIKVASHYKCHHRFKKERFFFLKIIITPPAGEHTGITDGIWSLILRHLKEG